MRDVRTRYLTDPTFHAVVDSMRALLQGARLTPSEVREAAMLACIIEEEHRPTSPLDCSDAELDKIRLAAIERRDSIIDLAVKQQVETTRQLLRDKGLL